jgi:hypothetical protein
MCKGGKINNVHSTNKYDYLPQCYIFTKEAIYREIPKDWLNLYNMYNLHCAFQRNTSDKIMKMQGVIKHEIQKTRSIFV